MTYVGVCRGFFGPARLFKLQFSRRITYAAPVAIRGGVDSKVLCRAAELAPQLGREHLDDRAGRVDPACVRVHLREELGSGNDAFVDLAMELRLGVQRRAVAPVSKHRRVPGHDTPKKQEEDERVWVCNGE